jgi:hypothetical protein
MQINHFEIFCGSLRLNFVLRLKDSNSLMLFENQKILENKATKFKICLKIPTNCASEVFTPNS